MMIPQSMNGFRCLVTAALLLAALPPSASAITLPVLEDSSTAPTAAAAKSAGKGTTLQILSTNKAALVRFGVGLMSGDISAARVSGAWLTVYVSAATKKSDLTLHRVTQEWSESGLSGTNSPTFSSTALFTLPSNSVVAKQFVVINVTETVKDWLTNPATDFGFAMAGSGVARVFLGAKEGAALGYPATLEIQELPITVSVGGNIGIGTSDPQKPLQVGDASVAGSEGMMRFASTVGPDSVSGAFRTWDIGVPMTGDDMTGAGYSFVIDDVLRGTGPEFVVDWRSGNVGIGTNTPNADAALQVNGKVRMGSEAGTSQAPNRSILVRRINSTSSATNQVVARVADAVTLERDGTPGGFLVRVTSPYPGPVITGTGIAHDGTPVSVYLVFYSGGVGVHQVFTTAQTIGHFRLCFGDSYSGADMTEVVLTRFVDVLGNDGANWIGTVTSTFNQ